MLSTPLAQAVFHKGLAHVPEQWRQDSPSDIPTILGRWVSELNELMEMRSMLRALLRVLGSRAGLKPNERPPVRVKGIFMGAEPVHVHDVTGRPLVLAISMVLHCLLSWPGRGANVSP
jgi:hypothetical protein